MTVSWKDGADERLVSAMVEEMSEAALVRSFVIVADVVGEDGDRTILTNAGVDQRASDTLGLLELGRIIETEGVRNEMFDE